MEPNLNNLSDYEKPLSVDKLIDIAVAFGFMIGLSIIVGYFSPAF